MKTLKVTLIIILINIINFINMSKYNLNIFTYIHYGALVMYKGNIISPVPFSLITYGFIHSNLNQLIGNIIFGGVILIYFEWSNGSLKTIIIYLLGIILAGIGSLLLYKETHIFTGASGGIFAIMGASIVYMFKNKNSLFLLLLNFIILRNLYYSYTIPHLNLIGHISGLLIGVIVMLIWKYDKENMALDKSLFKT